MMRIHLVGAAVVALLVSLATPVAAQTARPLPELIAEFVVSNRILADQGIIADGFGHLSIRSPTDPNRFYMSRARAAGMVTADDVMEFGLGGQPLDQRGRRLFSERFLHAEIYKARPDVNSVVHSHDPILLPFGLTG